MTQTQSAMREALHPVEVSELGYPMVKEPWKPKASKFNGYGVCCHDQALPEKCEHQRKQDAYKHLRVKPRGDETHDVYGHQLPLPPPRLTFLPLS